MLQTRAFTDDTPVASKKAGAVFELCKVNITGMPIKPTHYWPKYLMNDSYIYVNVSS